jgi:hypothetical protein
LDVRTPSAIGDVLGVALAPRAIRACRIGSPCALCRLMFLDRRSVHCRS